MLTDAQQPRTRTRARGPGKTAGRHRRHRGGNRQLNVAPVPVTPRYDQRPYPKANPIPRCPRVQARFDNNAGAAKTTTTPAPQTYNNKLND
jgi:hypothetical protein